MQNTLCTNEGVGEAALQMQAFPSARRQLPSGAAFNTSYCSERGRPEEISFPCLSVMCFL